MIEKSWILESLIKSNKQPKQQQQQQQQQQSKNNQSTHITNKKQSTNLLQTNKVDTHPYPSETKHTHLQ